MIVPLTLEFALQVTRAMRADDCREAYATRWNDDPDDLARECANFPGPKYAVLADDGAAIAIFGAVVRTPTLAEVWLIGTDRIVEKEEEIIKAGQVACLSLLHDAGFARLQAHTASYRRDTQAWLRQIGFLREGELKMYGKDGSTFYLYSMIDQANQHSITVTSPPYVVH